MSLETLKTLKNNYYVVSVNPLNHLSSNPCSLSKNNDLQTYSSPLRAPTGKICAWT